MSASTLTATPFSGTKPDLDPHGASQRLLALALALLWLFAPHAKAVAGPDLRVEVSMQEGGVFVDVVFHVRAMPKEAWAVMTDYDHATAFISKLERSVTLSRSGDTLLVSQKGNMGWGPFSVPLETLTEVRLTPYEKIQGRMVSGNLKKNESTTRLFADGGGTRVIYHLESIPDAWVPPLIGRALVEFETRARFRQLIDEILRRKASAETKC